MQYLKRNEEQGRVCSDIGPMILFQSWSLLHALLKRYEGLVENISISVSPFSLFSRNRSQSVSCGATAVL